MIQKKKLITTLVCLMSMATFVSAQQHTSAEWREWLDKKQFEKIVADTVSLQPADTADFSKMYLLGQAYEGLLRYQKAYNCYMRCYAVDSTRTDMLNTLARIAWQLGKGNEAEMYYKQVLRQDSTDFYANYQLARLYVQLENPKMALAYYDYLLERDPENAVILRAKGDCYTNIKDSLIEAKRCYQKAFLLNVENASLASTLINVLLNLYDPELNSYLEEARIVCDIALPYNPRNKTLRQRDAMIYYMLKEYTLANIVYTSLLADQDSSFTTLKFAGISRYHAKQWYDAAEVLGKAYEQDPTACDLCLLLGISIGRTYDPQAAFDYFDLAEECLVPDPSLLELLTQFRAEMYLKTGDCDKGSALYYQLWKDGKVQLAWLQQMQFCYGRKSSEDMSDEERQRALFIQYWYATELLEHPQRKNQMQQYSFLLSRLKKYNEEMFFRDVDSLPMITPEGKKTAISKEKLREVLRKLEDEK